MKENVVNTEDANLKEMESRKISDDDLDNVSGGAKMAGGGMKVAQKGGDE